MPFTSWKEHRKGAAVTYIDSEEKLVNQMNEPEDSSVVYVEEHPDGTDPFFRLNEMSEADLLEIKGIGPKTAQKIITQLPVTSIDEMTLSKSAKSTLSNWLAN